MQRDELMTPEQFTAENPAGVVIPSGNSPEWRRGRPQLWYDQWRNRWRVLRFMGACVSCGRRTYAFDDGEDDPRGVLGDHASSAEVASDHGKAGPDIPACFACMDEEGSYRYVVDTVAPRKWRDPS